MTPAIDIGFAARSIHGRPRLAGGLGAIRPLGRSVGKAWRSLRDRWTASRRRRMALVAIDEADLSEEGRRVRRAAVHELRDRLRRRGAWS